MTVDFLVGLGGMKTRGFSSRSVTSVLPVVEMMLLVQLKESTYFILLLSLFLQLLIIFITNVLCVFRLVFPAYSTTFLVFVVVCACLLGIPSTYDFKI